MYTVSEDVDDDHYADFVDTLRFLFDDEPDGSLQARSSTPTEKRSSTSTPARSRHACLSLKRSIETQAAPRHGANRTALHHTGSKRHVVERRPDG